MVKQKRPVIYNTTHKYNLNLVIPSDYALRQKVTEANFDSLKKVFSNTEGSVIDHLEHLNDVYEFYSTTEKDIELIELMAPKVAHIYVYTEDTIPVEIMDIFNRYSNGTLVYLWDKYQEYGDMVTNIQEAFKATEVILSLNISLPEDDPEQLLFGLYQVHTNVDQIILNFPSKQESQLTKDSERYYHKVNDSYLLNSEDKFRCFKIMQQPLSVWGMGIQLVANNVSEKALLNYYRDCDQGNVVSHGHKISLDQALKQN
jgi:hypothetical protein